MAAIAIALFASQSAADDHATAANQSTLQATPSQGAANDIFPDPAIRRGVLANGLRYAVMRNATPSGGVSLRLGIDAGTFEERESEHGVAHFVEHMAFNTGGSDHEEGPEKAFAAAGVGFGRDQNAETDMFKTVYRLDLPHADTASLDLAFHWLHDVVSHSAFADPVVERERGIVLAEREARRDPDLRAYEALERFIGPGLRSTRPNAIGTAEEIRDITAKRLEAFYARWYRPENAVLVVVGDAPVEAIEKRIQEAFGEWRGTGDMPVKPSFGAIDEKRPLSVLIRSEPHLPTELNICRLKAPPPHGADDVARLRKTTLSALWIDILNTRLANLAKARTAPFLSAEAGKRDIEREFDGFCLVASPLDDNWQTALTAAQTELRRLEAGPPSQDELDAAVATIRAGYRGAMRTAATRQSADLATAILDRTLRAEVVASPVEAFRAFDTAVEGVTPADVKGAFDADWAGAGPLVGLIAPDPPAASAVREAWGKNEELALPPLPAATTLAASSWSYGDFGPAGHVAKREAFQSPDFVRVTFANGVALNFKHTDFEQGSTKVRLRFGAGRREIANQDYIAATLGTGFFKIGGVGRHDFQDIQQLFTGWSWDASLEIRDDAFVLDGSSSANGLKNQMQILAAYVSDPGFRRDADVRLPSAIDSFYRQFRASPMLVLGNAVSEAIAPGNPLLMPSRESLTRLRMKDFERIFKPALVSAPLEITIVGDIDEATATELVAETFGAFPARSDGPRDRADTFFLRFPERDLPTVRVSHEGPQDQAMFDVLWPLYVATPERRREEVSLLLLSRVFDDALRHRIREELGKSYAPEVALYTPDHADQGYIHAVVESAPRDVDQLVAETRHIAQRLARGDFTDEDIETARKPFLAEMTARHDTNDWWLGGLSGSSKTHDGLDEMRDLENLVASITALEIRKAAADWLARPPLVVIALPTPKTASH